ncbi:MAG: cytidine deaminase [Ignavibacteria bacterium]|nr:cytidine deaminase [Ignavibacteria bacterium]
MDILSINKKTITLQPDYNKLIEYSIKARKFSYSPYSKFSVGAAVLTKDNKIFTGANIECASYSLCICAERVAYSKAVSEGYKKFTAVAISSSAKDYTFPCGACRQFMSEFGTDTEILIIKTKNLVRTFKLAELIPGVFDKKYLLNLKK